MTLENHRAFERPSDRQPPGYHRLTCPALAGEWRDQNSATPSWGDTIRACEIFLFFDSETVCDFRMAQKRCHLDEAKKFQITVSLPDNLTKPRNIVALADRCLPAIALVTRDGLHLPRKSVASPL
jgi:hypothetical protein